MIELSKYIFLALYPIGCLFALGFYIGHERNGRFFAIHILTGIIVTLFSWVTVGWAIGKIARNL